MRKILVVALVVLSVLMIGVPGHATDYYSYAGPYYGITSPYYLGVPTTASTLNMQVVDWVNSRVAVRYQFYYYWVEETQYCSYGSCYTQYTPRRQTVGSQGSFCGSAAVARPASANQIYMYVVDGVLGSSICGGITAGPTYGYIRIDYS